MIMLIKALLSFPFRLGFHFLARLLFGRSGRHVQYMMSSTEDSELKCSCGLPAKLRISRTSKNPYRLFYNCPNGLHSQCEFFRWHDEPSLTGDRNTDEINFIRNECIQLQHRLDELQQEHVNNRLAWDREKTELTSSLSSVQAELDDLKEKIRLVNESDLMPPVDKLSIVDEADDAMVIHTI